MQRIYQYIYGYIDMNLFTVHQKLMQHCKSTILQFLKKKSKTERDQGDQGWSKRSRMWYHLVFRNKEANN